MQEQDKLITNNPEQYEKLQEYNDPAAASETNLKDMQDLEYLKELKELCDSEINDVSP